MYLDQMSFFFACGKKKLVMLPVTILFCLFIYAIATRSGNNHWHFSISSFFFPLRILLALLWWAFACVFFKAY